MRELILHHVTPGSSHGEKTQLMLGYKGLEWRSVSIPPFMPRPLLTPVLTGGYRKTPVLQIGADIYCDTRCIARLLDRLKPDPPLFIDDTPGLCELIACWVEPRWFFNAAALARFQRPPEMPGVYFGPRILAWMDRVAAIGHGRSTPMDAREALEIAHRSESATKPYQDVEDAEGRRLGVLVSVAPDDYGKDRTVGE